MFRPHTSAIYAKSIVVDYFGIPIMVPIKHHITHIATDRDGEVFGFIGEPVMCKGDIWVLDLEGNSGEGCEYLATINFTGNWTESLLTLDPANTLRTCIIQYIQAYLTSKKEIICLMSCV